MFKFIRAISFLVGMGGLALNFSLPVIAEEGVALETKAIDEGLQSLTKLNQVLKIDHVQNIDLPIGAVSSPAMILRLSELTIILLSNITSSSAFKNEIPDVLLLATATLVISINNLIIKLSQKLRKKTGQIHSQEIDDLEAIYKVINNIKDSVKTSKFKRSQDPGQMILFSEENIVQIFDFLKKVKDLPSQNDELLIDSIAEVAAYTIIQFLDKSSVNMDSHIYEVFENTVYEVFENTVRYNPIVIRLLYSAFIYLLTEKLLKVTSHLSSRNFIDAHEFNASLLCVPGLIRLGLHYGAPK